MVGYPEALTDPSYQGQVSKQDACKLLKSAAKDANQNLNK